MPSTRRASLPATLKTCLAFIVELRKKNRGSERRLTTNFRTVFFREVKIAVRTMKIHSGTQHMRIDDKDFLARWTCNFNRLTHRLPRNHLLTFYCSTEPVQQSLSRQDAKSAKKNIFSLVRTWRPLRLCASDLFSNSVLQNSTENFEYL